MNCNRVITSAVCVFVALFLSDWVFHGYLLMDLYQETAHLWRSQEQMESYFPLMVGCQAALSLVISIFYARGYSGRGFTEGLVFGCLLGLVVGILQGATYAYMPISVALALAWLGISFVQGVLLGAVLGLTYKAE